MNREKYIASVKQAKSAKGKSDLLKYLDGKRLTQAQAIRAYCYDCMGFYIDGTDDCGNETCPLHHFMPYNPNRQQSVMKQQQPEKAVA